MTQRESKGNDRERVERMGERAESEKVRTI